MKSKIICSLAAVCCLLGLLTVMPYTKTYIQWGTVVLLATLLAALYRPPNGAVRLFFYAVFGLLAGIGIMFLVELPLLWVFPVCDDNGHACGMPMMQVFYSMVAACVLTPLLLYAYAKHAIHRHERAAVGALLAAAVLCGVVAWLGIV